MINYLDTEESVTYHERYDLDHIIEDIDDEITSIYPVIDIDTYIEDLMNSNVELEIVHTLLSEHDCKDLIECAVDNICSEA